MGSCYPDAEQTVVRFGISTQLYHSQRLAREHLVEIAAHGFDAVELVATRSHFDYHDAAAIDGLVTWLTEAGLRLHSIHAPFAERFEHGRWESAYSNASRQAAVRERAVREAAAAVEIARRVPVGFLVVHLGLPDSQVIPAGDNDRQAGCRSLEQLTALAAPLGVRVAVEVIPNALSTPDALVRLLEHDADLPQAGVCLDLGHAFLMGDPAEAVETLSGHVVTTHVHDNRGTSDDHLVPFEGGIDWPTALMALNKIGYEGTMMLELANTSTATAVLKHARAACARLEAEGDTWT
jgi:sugar phosphate isomerase/epimerase